MWEFWNRTILSDRKVINTWDHCPSLQEIFDEMIGWGYGQNFVIKRKDNKFYLHDTLTGHLIGIIEKAG